MGDGKTNDINIKTSSVIVGIAILLLSVLGWSLKSQYDSITRQLTKQWEKGDKMEKVICSNHPASCPDL